VSARPEHGGQAPHGAGETPRHTIGAKGEGGADLRQAREALIGQLSERGIDVLDADGDVALADLLTAVQRFERTRFELGGDSYVNDAESSQPDQEAFVMPQRGDDESIAQYTDRVNEAERRAASAKPDDGEATATRAKAVDDRGVPRDRTG
jgi:hypothetical protein